LDYGLFSNFIEIIHYQIKSYRSMTNQDQTSLANKLSLQYGLLIGVISVVLAVVFRIVDPMFQYDNWWVSLFTAVVMIVILVFLVLDIRKKIGGFWSYGEAFKSLIIIAVISILISTAYNFILFKYIDPEMPTKVNSIMQEKTSAMLEKFGADQSKIDDGTKQFRNGEFIASLQPTLVNELKAFGFGLIFYAIVDLIIAACVKKKAPTFAPPADEDTTV
jgi:hypothetical protein